MEQALVSLSDPGDPHTGASKPAGRGAGGGGGVGVVGRCRDLVGSDGLVVGEEGAARMLALVPELFPIELKTPPPPPLPPVPLNAFAPLELDPAKKGAGVTLDPSAPLRLSGTDMGNYQLVLTKKGFTVGAGTVGFGYFEVGGDGGRGGGDVPVR